MSLADPSIVNSPKPIRAVVVPPHPNPNDMEQNGGLFPIRLYLEPLNSTYSIRSSPSTINVFPTECIDVGLKSTSCLNVFELSWYENQIACPSHESMKFSYDCYLCM